MGGIVFTIAIPPVSSRVDKGGLLRRFLLGRPSLSLRGGDPFARFGAQDAFHFLGASALWTITRAVAGEEVAGFLEP